MMPLSRRVTPMPAPTAAAAALPSPTSPAGQSSPPTPDVPPGFSSPRFGRSALALQLFPQLACISDPGASPPRFALSGSSFVPDSMDCDVPATFAAAEGLELLSRRGVSFASPLMQALQTSSRIHGAPARPCLKSAGRSSTSKAPVLRAAPQLSPIPTPARQEAEVLLQAAPDSSPAALAGHSSFTNGQASPGSSEEDWTTVRAPYWWRKQGIKRQSSHRKRRPASLASSFRLVPRGAFVKPHKRVCRRCLEKGHHVKECRDPVRCWLCKGWRHLARECKGDRSSDSSSCSGSSSLGPASSPSTPSTCPSPPSPPRPAAATALASRPNYMHRRDSRDWRRDDDRDDDRDRRGQGDDRAWHQRFFCSRSRATEQRPDDRGERHSCRGDGSVSC